MRARGGWTKKAECDLSRVEDVLSDLREHWPLTLRQIYYQLVAAGHIENNRNAYSKLSRLLTRARLDGRVSWAAMEDRSRSMLKSGGWSDAEDFTDAETENLLTGYRRDLLQSQAVRPEIWIEKDALSRVCHKAAFAYCVPVIVARGFSSVSFLHEARERILRNRDAGQRTRVLYFGDLDPSGWAMLPAMMETLCGEMDLGGVVDSVRCGLTPEQVEAYRLPINPDALKDTDSRAAKYREQFGSLAVELDAMRPDDLAALAETAIRENLDLSQFEAERAVEDSELVRLHDLRRRIVGMMGGG
jgi:hypothetical protein